MEIWRSLEGGFTKFDWTFGPLLSAKFRDDRSGFALEMQKDSKSSCE